MNIVLFEPEEAEAGALPLDDSRANHIREILRRAPGEAFDAGIVNGPCGKGFVQSWGEKTLGLSFEWGDVEAELPPVEVVVGLSRPQTCRKLLQEATSLEVRRLRFAACDRSEPSYAQSRLWTAGEWRRHLVAGAAQAFSTRIPEVDWPLSLEAALEATTKEALRLALDNYEAQDRLGGQTLGPDEPVCLAIGPERGWSGAERELLRGAGFQLVHIGERPLRSETALAVALGLIHFMRSSPRP